MVMLTWRTLHLSRVAMLSTLRAILRGRICCDIDPDKVSAGQPDDDEDIEQVKANGRNPARWLRAGSSG